MGWSYVILGLVMGVSLVVALNVGTRAGNVTSTNGNSVDIGGILGLLVVPTSALVGLVITTPVYLLFVNDKNSGVSEYLLAVGMNQRDIFMGYLKAALMLSLLSMVPVVLINLVLASAGTLTSVIAGVLAIATGLSDVSLVTVLMTAFGSMQRRPNGMNSPVGISIGIVFLLPEFLLVAVLGAAVFWLEAGVALGIMGIVAGLFLSLDRLIKREKLLP